MDAQSVGISISLALLTAALGFLSARAFVRGFRSKVRVQMWWAGGLAMAGAAMGVETIVYLGVVDQPLLQSYVFLSAALVGILSIGACRVLRRPRVESAYSWYILGACGVLAVASFETPLSADMVTQGIITGNPPLSILILSTLVTGPATVVLLASAASSLRRSRDWRTLLMVAGALVLGAGGTLYIASFPVALYYAEFLGILLLFAGLMSLKPAGTTAPAPGAATA
ncbi:MAG: hypothetical protein L3K19_00670 [Thermoplasmata archaeon]|nr:hypothetical protein [Thermoplasmata archaeon]